MCNNYDQPYICLVRKSASNQKQQQQQQLKNSSVSWLHVVQGWVAMKNAKLKVIKKWVRTVHKIH